MAFFFFFFFFFAKCLHVDEDGPRWVHPCHLDTFLVYFILFFFFFVTTDFTSVTNIDMVLKS